MTPLRLSPFPVYRVDDQSQLLLMEREGFVDEAVVAAHVASSNLGRSMADPDDLALASDDLDFAGWRLSKSATVRSPEVPPQVISAIVCRALHQVSDKPTVGSRRSTNHRWWLTGLAGMLISCLLLTLPGHFGIHRSPQITRSSNPVSLRNDESPKNSSVETPIGR